MDLLKYFTFSMIISILGIKGILLNRQNIPIMSMSIESLFLAVNLNFLVFSISLDDMMGQSFASLVPTVAAVEYTIRSGIFVLTFQVRGMSNLSITFKVKENCGRVTKDSVLFSFCSLLSFSFSLIQFYC